MAFVIQRHQNVIKYYYWLSINKLEQKHIPVGSIVIVQNINRNHTYY